VLPRIYILSTDRWVLWWHGRLWWWFVPAYCKTLFFRCILISRFSYVENWLHFNLADFPVKCWYSMQVNLWWWAVTKIRVYLISRFCSNHENLMLAKCTCFAVIVIQCNNKWEILFLFWTQKLSRHIILLQSGNGRMGIG